MRVLCVSKDAPLPEHPVLRKAIQDIVIGDPYTVVREVDDKYELAEFPHPLTILWLKRCFIPLSDIDETEMSRDYNVVKALFP